MPNTKTPKSTTTPSTAALFARLWETDRGQLSPTAAQLMLTLRFSDADKARMHELAVKNQEGHITAEEREELGNYVTVADLLSLLKSKARRLLKKGQEGGDRHG